MEWCWVFQEIDRQDIERFPDLYKHAYPHPNGRPNMFVIERHATQLHASRRNLKGGRWADVKRRSSRYKRSTGINLVLTDYGVRKIDVIKAIRNLFNYTLR